MSEVTHPTPSRDVLVYDDVAAGATPKLPPDVATIFYQGRHGGMGMPLIWRQHPVYEGKK